MLKAFSRSFALQAILCAVLDGLLLASCKVRFSELHGETGRKPCPSSRKTYFVDVREVESDTGVWTTDVKRSCKEDVVAYDMMKRDMPNDTIGLTLGCLTRLCVASLACHGTSSVLDAQCKADSEPAQSSPE